MLTRKMAKPMNDKEEALDKRKEENKKLIEKYPFLKPLNWQLGEIENYDYSYTELDNGPDGWKNIHLADGRFYLDALKDAIIADKIDLNRIRVVQAKEKYGSYRLYFSAEGDEMEKVLNEIERISEVTCCECGAPATKISKGWICPYCDKCAEELSKKREYPVNFVPIDEDPFKNMEEI